MVTLTPKPLPTPAPRFLNQFSGKVRGKRICVKLYPDRVVMEHLKPYSIHPDKTITINFTTNPAAKRRVVKGGMLRTTSLHYAHDILFPPNKR